MRTPPPDAAEYRLGGSAALPALAPATNEQLPERARLGFFRLPLSSPTMMSKRAATASTFDSVSVFGSEENQDGEDVLRLGSAFTSGRATTGLIVSYGETSTVTTSEAFFDYALSDTIKVGISGILSDQQDKESDPVTGLGISASYALGRGAFVQGGIADTPDTSPVLGVAVGLRF